VTSTIERHWRTGPSGEFRLDAVPAGRLRVLVRHPEFVEALTDLITLAPGAVGKLNIVLDTGGALEGVVTESNGQAATGVIVTLAADRGSRESSVTTAQRNHTVACARR
jgi:hypothetical protein